MNEIENKIVCPSCGEVNSFVEVNSDYMRCVVCNYWIKKKRIRLGLYNARS